MTHHDITIMIKYLYVAQPEQRSLFQEGLISVHQLFTKQQVSNILSLFLKCEIVLRFTVFYECKLSRF